MKILLLSGIPNWAGHFRCKNLKKHLTGHEVDIEPRHPHDIAEEEFTKMIKSYDIVHFNYTGFVTKFLDVMRLKSVNGKVKNTILTLVSHRAVEGFYDYGIDLDEFISRCGAITAVNPILAKEFNCTYIPNGVDEEVFKPKGKFRVGFVGQKTPYKGFDLIKKACKELDCELITDPSTYPANVISQEEIAKLYHKMDCYVCASEKEGSVNPVMEALASNVPVLTTDVGIASELNVIKIERSVEGIKKGIEKLMGRKQILEKYNWKKISRQYFKVYKELLKKYLPV